MSAPKLPERLEGVPYTSRSTGELRISIGTEHGCDLIATGYDREACAALVARYNAHAELLAFVEWIAEQGVIRGDVLFPFTHEARALLARIGGAK